MLRTIIKVNDKYLTGELEDQFYTSSSFSGVGFHDYKGRQLSVLGFSDDKQQAKIFEGNTNLKSYLDRVLLRVKDKHIVLKTIEIECVDD